MKMKGFLKRLVPLLLALVLTAALLPNLAVPASAGSVEYNGFNLTILVYKPADCERCQDSSTTGEHSTYSCTVAITNNNGTLTISGKFKYECKGETKQADYSFTYSGFSCDKDVNVTAKKVYLSDGEYIYYNLSRSKGHTNSTTVASTCTTEGSITWNNCAVCGTSGSTPIAINSNAHNWGAWVSNGDNTHTRTCGYNSSHKDTKDCSGDNTANCTTAGTCTTCGGSYKNANNHSAAEDWSWADKKHYHVCTNGCGTKLNETACSYSTATCMAKATCSICHNEYGDVDPNAHSWGDWAQNADGKTHTRICSLNSSHIDTSDCSGGTATCLAQPICAKCQTAYGSKLTHNYVYSADVDDEGNPAIVETCTSGCDHREYASLLAPASTVFTGEPVNATFATSGNFQGSPSFSQTGENVTVTGSPVVATLTCSNAAVNCSYTITPASVIDNSENYSGNYDGKPHGISLNISTPGSTPTITYSLTQDGVYTATAPTFTNVTPETTVYYKVEAENYEPCSGSRTVTISKTPLNIIAVGKTITYKDPAPEYTASYDSFAEGEDVSDLTGTLEFSCDYEQGDNAGSYTITPSGLTSDNYDINYVTGYLEVEPADGEASVTIEGWTYGDTPNAPVLSTETNDIHAVVKKYKVKGADDSTYSSTVPTDAGDYTLQATFFETRNYNRVVVTTDFTIASKKIDVTAVLADTARNVPYKGEAYTPVPTLSAPNGLVGNDAFVKNHNYELVYANNVNAGTATVTVKSMGNYSFDDIVLEFRITKLTPTLDLLTYEGPASDSLVYDGTKKEATVTANLPQNHTGLGQMTVKYYDEKGKEAQPIAAGTYTIKVSFAEGTNYEANAGLTREEWTFTIAVNEVEAPILSVVSNGKKFVYNGKAQTPDILVWVADPSENDPIPRDQYDVTYENNINAGTATITVTLKDNYSGTGSTTFQITKAPLTITAEDKVAAVGAAKPKLTYTVTGLVKGEKLTKEPTLTCTANMKKAGIYTITPSGAAASDNYTISYVNGKLAVKTEYNVKVASTSNGTVTVDTRTAISGTKVTITATPKNSWYYMKTLVVTDAAGKSVAVYDSANGKYSFVMPESDVTVTATFGARFTYISDKSNPKTGDTILLPVMTMALSAAAMALLLATGKRRSRK